MKILYNTSITQIGTDTVIRPNSAYWFLKNQGTVQCLIDNNMVLFQDEIFGLDTTNMFVLGKTFDIKDLAELKIRFDTTLNINPQ